MGISKECSFLELQQVRLGAQLQNRSLGIAWKLIPAMSVRKQEQILNISGSMVALYCFGASLTFSQNLLPINLIYRQKLEWKQPQYHSAYLLYSVKL